jgi:hypothetical protein
MKIKAVVDALMTIALPALMAFQITGQWLHEWLGAGMLLLFAVHNSLNVRWYANLPKGGYKPLRILRTVINFGILAAVLSLAYSGIVMSQHVFRFLPIHGGMALARSLHMAGSYWAFVLMSMHLGLHWGMVSVKLSKLPVWVLRIIASVAAGYGAVCFFKLHIASYLFFRVQFAFFDFDKGAGTVFAEYICMLVFWAYIVYYGVRIIERMMGKQSRKK